MSIVPEADCRFRGAKKATRVLAGQRVELFHCDRFGSCQRSTSHVEGIASCQGCDSREAIGRPLCSHLGTVIRQDTADLCGMRGVKFDVYSCSEHGECSLRKYRQRQTARSCVTCDDYQDPPDRLIAPIRGRKNSFKSWEGAIVRKPWEYRITAVIPVLDTPEPLEAVVALLRTQSERPYILIIDTGSIEYRDRIGKLAGEDCEVHFLRSHAWRHSSEPVAVACQLGQEMVKTEFVFQTHADCLLKRRELLAEWSALAATHKIVGYQITPRPYAGWQTELGHTALMYHAPSTRGMSWNMSSFCQRHGVDLGSEALGMNRPDTESEMNAWLADHGIKPLMLGTENNMVRNDNADFDHPRSYCSSKLYGRDYHATIKVEMNDAIAKAWDRVKEWSAIGL